MKAREIIASNEGRFEVTPERLRAADKILSALDTAGYAVVEKEELERLRKLANDN